MMMPEELAGLLLRSLLAANVLLLALALRNLIARANHTAPKADNSPVLELWDDETPEGEVLAPDKLLEAIRQMRETARDERVLDACGLLAQIKHSLANVQPCQVVSQAQAELEQEIRPGLSIKALEKRGAEVRATLLDLRVVGPEWQKVRHSSMCSPRCDF